MSNILDSDFLIEVAKGNIAGHEIVQTVGRNPNVGKQFEDVWCGGYSCFGLKNIFCLVFGCC